VDQDGGRFMTVETNDREDDGCARTTQPSRSIQHDIGNRISEQVNLYTHPHFLIIDNLTLQFQSKEIQITI